jgi:plastocyanin
MVPMRPALSLRVAVMVAAPVLVSGCGASHPAAPPVATVTLQNTAYNPAALSVHVGDAVTWVWADGNVPHNIDGASDLSSFDSGAPTTTGSWTYRFNKAGTYTYHCDVHPGMIGTVTVG